MPLSEKQKKALEDVSLIEKLSQDEKLVLFKHIKENKTDFTDLNSKIKDLGIDLENAINDLELLDGKQGEQGVQGEKGDTGDNGEDGIKGDKGDAGNKGKDGVDGLDGEDGKDGLEGLVGVTGDKGDIGDKPDHKWNGTKLAFEKPDGELGKYVDLKGKPGASGSFLQNSSGKMIEVQSDGDVVTSSLKTVNFAEGLKVTDNGNGSIKVDADGSEVPFYWERTGTTLEPKTANDNVSIGTGTLTAGTITDGTFNLTGGAITGATGNISMWTNDSGYLTTETDPVFSAWLSTPPNISTFTNDAGYLTPATALFTRTGTELTTTNAGDDLDIDGDIYANKMLGINLLAGETPAKELDIKGELNFQIIASPVNTMAYTLGGPGNKDNGTVRYKVTFECIRGETNLSSIYTSVTVTDNTTNGQVLFTDVPISVDDEVTSRKIYRGKVGSSTSTYYYVGEIADNTTTTFTDNIADASLPAGDYRNKDNFSSGRIYKDNSAFGFFGKNNMALGWLSLGNNLEPIGYFNFGLGTYSLKNLTIGNRNTNVGTYSGQSITSGSNNVALGAYSMIGGTTCYDNLAIGSSALRANSSGKRNVAIGNQSFTSWTGSYGMAEGWYSGYTATSGSGMMAYGYECLRSTTVGTAMTSFGYKSGQKPDGVVANACTTSTYCSFFGYQSGLGSTTQRTYSIAIGAKATVDADSTCSIGGQGVYAVDLFVTKNLKIGNGDAGVDYTLTFDGETNDGVITWMEDEDYFEFADDVLFPDNEAVQFGTGVDSKMFYDGTDMKIVTDYVAPSDLIVDCGTDKTIELAETVWKDINMGSAQLARPSSSQPDLVNFVDEAGADTGIQTYGFAVGEKVHGSFELQHDYKEGSDFTFHVHWQGITAPTGTDNVQWRLTYTFGIDDATLDAVTIIDSADTPFDTQYEFVRSDIVVISGTNRKIGDQMLFTLERVAATGDAYAGDASIATAGIHYEVDTVGSRQIIAK